MIELKGNRQCLFLKHELIMLNNLSGEIVDNEKVKFVFFYEPKEMIKFLYSKKVKFDLKYYGHGSSIYIDLGECMFIDE